MTASFVIFAAWAIFAGTHLWMSASRLRETLTPRIGPAGFTVLYSIVTFVTLSVLMVTIAYFGHQGAKGFQIANPSLRFVLHTGSGLGAYLIIAGLVSFPKSPISKLAQRIHSPRNKLALRPPTGIERITRHPFFTGLAILSLCHIFLASTFAIATFFAGLAAISVVGVPMQDRKLRKRWADVYARYEEQSSVVPFAKIHKQSERPDRSEYTLWIACLIATIILFGVLHPIWTFANGAGFLAIVLIYGSLGVAVSVVRGISSNRRPKVRPH